MRSGPSYLRAAFLVMGASLLLVSCAGARAQNDSMFGPLPVFEFHSGFWLNLHHTLYHEAKARITPVEHQPGKYAHPVEDATALPQVTLTPAEQRAWNDAVNYYAANYATRDLLFSNDLILLKNQLGDFEDCEELSGTKKKTCDAGLPGDITRLLEAAGVVYRAHFWVQHDRANRGWIARVAPLVREQGVGLSERLASIYQTRWPKNKIRVDVSAYANWSGAYTTLDPLRVMISSLDRRNQSAQALEVLFHEASHGIAEPVELAIARECKQRDKAIPRDLWHALIFYTTGEVIRPVMTAANDRPTDGTLIADAGDGDTPGGGYTPYAVKEGLYQRGWDDYLKVLTRFWQPYLDGKASFDDAIARMVSSL
ncbi:MAG: hypothetical protein ABSG16_05815 [Candidatus Acidiferrum sp.]|jgi:hypothetical protein